MFAWESSEKGTELHLQSEPTKLEFMKKHVEEKKGQLEDTQSSKILEKVPFCYVYFTRFSAK